MLMSWLRLAAAAAIACWPAAAPAQAPQPRRAEHCGVSFDPVVISQDYNPLSPNDYVVSFNATARRPGFNASAEYSAVLLRQLDDHLPSQLYVVNDDGRGGAGRILYQRPGPNLRPGLNESGEIDLDFNASLGQSVSRPFEMQLRIPAGAEIAPGLYHAEYDVKYLCNYFLSRSDSGIEYRAFDVYFNVASAVQASLVGPEPDFGEVGTLSDLDVAAASRSRNERRHYVRIASSGPYEINVVSQNGWYLTAGGAPTGRPSERIRYRYEVLGQRLDPARPNFTPVRCQSSGPSGENIPLVATLTGGGRGKDPSSNYEDRIVITITPMAAWTGGTERCE